MTSPPATPSTVRELRPPLTRVERVFAWLELAAGSAMVVQGIRMWIEVLAPTPNPDFPGRGMALLLVSPIVPWGLLGFMLPGALLLARVRWTQFLAVLAATPFLAWGMLWAIQGVVNSMGDAVSR